MNLMGGPPGNAFDPKRFNFYDEAGATPVFEKRPASRK